jgi:hypothetical protein
VSVFDDFKARLDHLFAEQGGAGGARGASGDLRDALIEAKAAVSGMRSALAASERELVSERRQLEDAERRGRLAAEIADAETVSVAERFAARHRERADVLQRKLAVQRDELMLAEREVEELSLHLKTSRQSGPAAGVDAAWRDIEAAGGARPGTDLDDELLKARAERAAHEAAAEAQLAYLKKKLGKQP